jgi:hypothetical protein
MDAITLLEQEGIMNPLQASPTGGRFPLSRSSTTRSVQGNEEQTTAPVQPSPTGTRYGASLGRATPLGAQTTGSPRKWGGTTPQCPACSKNVYFAEQVSLAVMIAVALHVDYAFPRSRRLGRPTTRLVSDVRNAGLVWTRLGYEIMTVFRSALGVMARYDSFCPLCLLPLTFF